MPEKGIRWLSDHARPRRNKVGYATGQLEIVPLGPVVKESSAPETTMMQ